MLVGGGKCAADPDHQVVVEDGENLNYNPVAAPPSVTSSRYWLTWLYVIGANLEKKYIKFIKFSL